MPITLIQDIGTKEMAEAFNLNTFLQTYQQATYDPTKQHTAAEQNMEQKLVDTKTNVKDMFFFSLFIYIYGGTSYGYLKGNSSDNDLEIMLSKENYKDSVSSLNALDLAKNSTFDIGTVSLYSPSSHQNLSNRSDQLKIPAF